MRWTAYPASSTGSLLPYTCRSPKMFPAWTMLLALPSKLFTTSKKSSPAIGGSRRLSQRPHQSLPAEALAAARQTAEEVLSPPRSLPTGYRTATSMRWQSRVLRPDCPESTLDLRDYAARQRSRDPHQSRDGGHGPKQHSRTILGHRPTSSTHHRTTRARGHPVPLEKSSLHVMRRICTR